jgi:hypothetical protein
MQLGGSLMETFTVPMFVVGVCICVLPLQPTPIAAETSNANPASNKPVFR